MINRKFSTVLDGKRPYEILFNVKSSYRHIRVFGCLCYVYNNQRPKGKFGDRSKRCNFIRYPHGKKGWIVYDIQNKNIFVIRDVIFCEKNFLSLK